MKRQIFLIMVGVVALMAGCRPEGEHIVVEPEQLYGLWQKEGTQEMWSYRENGTGYTWDVAELSEDVQEGDSGTVAYRWSINNGDRLRHQYSGTNIGDMVVRTHTITSISENRMVREEE